MVEKFEHGKIEVVILPYVNIPLVPEASLHRLYSVGEIIAADEMDLYMVFQEIAEPLATIRTLRRAILHIRRQSRCPTHWQVHCPIPQEIPLLLLDNISLMLADKLTFLLADMFSVLFRYY